MNRYALGAAAALALVLSATPAGATLLQFTLTGSLQLSFQVDSRPENYNPIDASSVSVGPVDGVVRGKPDTLYLFFSRSKDGGGLSIANQAFETVLLSTGPQLYTGKTTDATLLTGTFNLSQAGGRGKYVLTVAPVFTTVPEPATWGLMVFGFGVVGASLRPQRRRTIVAYGYSRHC